jgi:hypothetical protein
MKSRTSLFLLSAMLMASTVSAQIVFGEAKPAATEAKPAAEATAAKDPALEAWIQVLVKRLGDQNAAINTSVTSGLVAIGAPAVPALQAIAAGSDEAQAKAAKDVLAQIERRGRRPGQPGGAEGRPGGAQSAQALLDSMNLDKDTRAKAEKARVALEEKTRELFTQMQDGELSREEMREAFRELREKAEAEMKGLLGDENFEKYRSSMGGGRMGGRMGGGEGGQPGGGRRGGGQGGGGQGGGGQGGGAGGGRGGRG